LAYVEWYSKIPSAPEQFTKLYKLKKEFVQAGGPSASVIPIEWIERSVQVYPKWGPRVPEEWTSENILDIVPTIYLSPYKDCNTFFN
jgi:hypothetical protein